MTSGPQSVMLTITTAANLAPGTYHLTIDGIAGSSNLTSSFSFTVVPYIVFINNQSFTPANYTVPMGATVMWMNLEGIISQYDPGDHNVAFQTGITASSTTLHQYNTYSYTFTQAGTFTYICTIHPFMKGAIIVH